MRSPAEGLPGTAAFAAYESFAEQNLGKAGLCSAAQVKWNGAPVRPAAWGSKPGYEEMGAQLRAKLGR